MSKSAKGRTIDWDRLKTANAVPASTDIKRFKPPEEKAVPKPSGHRPKTVEELANTPAPVVKKKVVKKSTTASTPAFKPASVIQDPVTKLEEVDEVSGEVAEETSPATPASED